MSLITVVRDVCAVVGVAAPVSVIAAIGSNRTMFEMLACANEMAQRIAYDTRDWTGLVAGAQFDPVSSTTSSYGSTTWNLPDNYKRMLLTSNVRRVSSPDQSLVFVSDVDQWRVNRLKGTSYSSYGEWMILGRILYVYPRPADTDRIDISYLDKNCIVLASGGHGDRFQSDEDTFRLDERLLKLGMIYDWKMKKGSPYAEDMGTYQDAVNMVMGHDKPAPIIIGRLPMQGRVAYSGYVPYP